MRRRWTQGLGRVWWQRLRGVQLGSCRSTLPAPHRRVRTRVRREPDAWPRTPARISKGAPLANWEWMIRCTRALFTWVIFDVSTLRSVSAATARARWVFNLGFLVARTCRDTARAHEHPSYTEANPSDHAERTCYPAAGLFGRERELLDEGGEDHALRAPNTTTSGCSVATPQPVGAQSQHHNHM
jgi:hypothetical protein